MVSNGSRNSIHDTGEHHTKTTCLSEKNAINECVDEILIVCIASQEGKQVKTKINTTGLNLQILIAIQTVIVNKKMNKL